MNDTEFEAMLRDALKEEPPVSADSAVADAIRREAARRGARRKVLLWTRRAAAAAAILVLAVLPVRQRRSGNAETEEPGDGEIILEIIGLASPGDFYAEE